MVADWYVASRGIRVGLLLLVVGPMTAHGYDFDTSGYLAEAFRWPAWSDTVARHQNQRQLIADCLDDVARCSRPLRGMRVIIERGATLPLDKRLALVNRYINRRGYRRERILPHASVATSSRPAQAARAGNRWQTLVEFLERGGDCEDFATAKYFLLREMGVPEEDLRVLVVYDRTVREHHAVVAVRRPGGPAWLLEIDNTILRRDRPGGRSSYRPVYAMSERSIWDYRKLAIVETKRRGS
jgi:hypothetical protein